MPSIDANGLRLNYDISGPHEGAWVTLSHCHATNFHLWDRLTTHLVERGFRVLRYDTRGHGTSESAPPPYNFSQLADDVLALWNALEIDMSDFVGLSLGGSTGLAIAIEHPERIGRVVASDCHAWASPEFRAAWEPRIRLALEQGMDALIPSTIERWFTNSFIAANPPELGAIKDMIRTTSRDGYIGCAQALQNIDYSERLDRISSPVLMLAGELDPAATPQSVTHIASRIPGARFVAIPNAAHLPNIQNVRQFNDEVVAFLMPEPR